MMIGIEYTVTGEFLDLFPDTRLNLKLRNPIFGDGDIIPGSFAFPFRVPGPDKSAINAKLLGAPDEPAARSSHNPNGWALWIDGVRWKTGKLIIENATGREVNLRFNFGLTTISDDFKTKKIREIIAQEVVLSSTDFIKTIGVTLISTDSERTITINGTTFTFTGFGSLGAIINGIEYNLGTTLAGTAQAFVTAINNASITPAVSATYVSSGTFNVYADAGTNDLTIPLKVECDTVNWSLFADSTFVTNYNSSIISWLNTNFNTATPADERLRFCMVHNNPYQDSISGIVTNLMKTSGYVLNLPTGGGGREPLNETSICPQVRWQYLLEAVVEHFDIEMEGDFLLYNHPEWALAVLPNARTIDVAVPFVGQTPWIACARSFNLRDFVPDWTVPEFLKALGKRFNLAVYFNEATGRLRLQPRENILSWSLSLTPNAGGATTVQPNPDRDITHTVAALGSIDDFGKTGYRLSAVRNGKNLQSIEDFFDAGTPEDELEIPITGYFLQESRWVGNAFFPNLVVAQIKKDEAIFPTLLFYQWRSTAGIGPIFNYAGADINPEANTTLALAGANGWAKKRYARYLQFLRYRKRIAMEFNWGIAEVKRLDWEEKLRVFNTCYLLNEVDLTIDMSGRVTCRATAYTIGQGVAV